MKTAIVTDSTAYLPADLREALHIHMIPLTVTLDGEVYEEEIDLKATEFYDKVRGDGPLPKTSQPPIGKFIELFESLKGTYDAVISIHLSSGISGTYAGAVQAGEMVEGIETHVFDSEISCYLQGFYVIRAAELAQEGATPDQIMAELDRNETDDARLFHGGRPHASTAGRSDYPVHRRSSADYFKSNQFSISKKK